jgi:hypothetical protein
MADKVHALLDQLMRASPGPYIDAKRSTCTEPYSLLELAARAVAGSRLKDLGMHTNVAAYFRTTRSSTFFGSNVAPAIHEKLRFRHCYWPERVHSCITANRS